MESGPNRDNKPVTSSPRVENQRDHRQSTGTTNFPGKSNRPGKESKPRRSYLDRTHILVPLPSRQPTAVDALGW